MTYIKVSQGDIVIYVNYLLPFLYVIGYFVIVIPPIAMTVLRMIPCRSRHIYHITFWQYITFGMVLGICFLSCWKGGMSHLLWYTCWKREFPYFFAVKILRRSALLWSESSCRTHPLSFHTLPAFLGRRSIANWINIGLCRQHPNSQIFVSFLGCQKGLVGKIQMQPLPGLCYNLASPDLKSANHSPYWRSRIVPFPESWCRWRHNWKGLHFFSKW